MKTIQKATKAIDAGLLRHIRKSNGWRPLNPGIRWWRALTRLVAAGKVRYDKAMGGYVVVVS